MTPRPALRTAAALLALLLPLGTAQAASLTPGGDHSFKQLLTADDFTQEQAYHIESRRRHNRLFHTPGVAHGLEVGLKDGKIVGLLPLENPRFGSHVCFE